MAIQLEQCRSQLASIISTERLRECEGFIDKVGETRYNKVKNRQIKKFQNLVNKKEGNITWSSNNNNNLPQVVNNPNRQAGAPLPPGEGINTPQQDLSILLRREKVLISCKQLPPLRPLLNFLPRKRAIPRQLCTFPPRKEAIHPQQVGPLGGSSWGRQQSHYSSPSHYGRRQSSLQTGQSNNQNRSNRQGTRHSNRHRVTQASQENNTVSWEDNTTTTPY